MKVLISGTPGEAYNIGNTNPELSVLGLADLIEKVLERPIPKDIIEHPDSYPADEPQRRCPDLRKASQHLEYTPKVDIEDGLKRYLNWTDSHYSGEIL